MIDIATIRRDLDEAVAGADVDQLDHLIGVLEMARLRVTQRLAPDSASPAALVEAAEMAHLLAVSENWVRDAGRAGRIPTVRIGHYVRFSPPAVLDAVRSLPPQPQNGGFCAPKKRQENRGGRRRVSTECPESGAHGRRSDPRS